MNSMHSTTMFGIFGYFSLGWASINGTPKTGLSESRSVPPSHEPQQRPTMLLLSLPPIFLLYDNFATDYFSRNTNILDARIFKSKTRFTICWLLNLAIYSYLLWYKYSNDLVGENFFVMIDQNLHNMVVFGGSGLWSKYARRPDGCQLFRIIRATRTYTAITTYL